MKISINLTILAMKKLNFHRLTTFLFTFHKSYLNIQQLKAAANHYIVVKTIVNQI